MTTVGLVDGDPDGLIDAYLGSLGTRRPRTIETYEQHLRNLSTWCGASGLTVAQCSSADIARYLHSYRQRGVTERTINQYGNSARRFYQWAVRGSHLTSDPTAGVVASHLPSPPRQHYVSLPDMRRLVAASLTDPAEAAVILLHAVLGVGVQEVSALDVQDYRRTATGATLTTRRAGSPLTHELPPLMVSVFDHLVGHRTRGPLLLTNRGNSGDRAFINRIIRRVAEQAGVTPPPSSRDLAASMRHIAVSEGFGFAEIVRAVADKSVGQLLQLVDRLPTPKRPASFRMAALLRPDHDSDAALLEQAHALAYTNTHPAVRVMLAGAVLERHMRSLAGEAHSHNRPPSKPDGTGITTWTGPLTGSGVLTPDDSRDCQFVADRRNEAAHGHFHLATESIAEDVIARVQRLMDAHPLAAARAVAVEPRTDVPSLRPARRVTPVRPTPAAKRVHRDVIPDKAKIYVWQRDQGRCVRCGTNENLEYDHIIPLSMGGSNTARNLQLLCAMCNRSKGAKIV